MPKIFLWLLLCALFSCKSDPIAPDLQISLQKQTQTYQAVKAGNTHSELFTMLQKNTSVKQQYDFLVGKAYQIYGLGGIYTEKIKTAETLDSQAINTLRADYQNQVRHILTPFFTTIQPGIRRKTLADLDELTDSLYAKYNLKYPENAPNTLKKTYLQSQIASLTQELINYLGYHIGNPCGFGFYQLYIRLENPPAQVRFGEAFQTELSIGQEATQLYKFLSASSQLNGDSNLIYHIQEIDTSLSDSINLEMPVVHLERLIPPDLPVGEHFLLIRAEIQNVQTGQIYPIEQKLYFNLKTDYER